MGARHRSEVARRWAPGLQVLGAAVLILAAGAGSAAGFGTELVIGGLSKPLYVTGVDHPAAGELLYIVEQTGRIKVMQEGVLQTEPFLDLSALVETNGSEQGLLGLALAPDYTESGVLYVDYTRDGDGATVVARYGLLGGDPLQADPASAETVLSAAQPFSNHNGGWIDFGPDGYLYIALGDGGSGGDPGNRAQTLSTALGKILRIDVSPGCDPYCIPPDNPYADSPGGAEDPRPEIWAYGVRNPWRNSFDRATGDLWIADVGQNAWEEINMEEAGFPGGGNYGWRLMEGTHCYNPPNGCQDGTLIEPIHEYSHSVGFSITGGYVYRGEEIPELHGHYFFADFVTAQIWSLTYDGNTVTVYDRTAELDPPGGDGISQISSFGQGPRGELYILERGSGSNGQIFRLVPDPASVPESGGRLGGPRLDLRSGNPFRDQILFDLAVEQPGEVSVEILSVSGSVVRRLASGFLEAGTRGFVWDGLDGSGRPAPSGVYYICAISGGRQATSPVRLVR